MPIEEHRQQTLNTLLAKTNARGMTCFDESFAKRLLDQLSDEELEEGILLNTPEGVAEVLPKVGAL